MSQNKIAIESALLKLFRNGVKFLKVRSIDIEKERNFEILKEEEKERTKLPVSKEDFSFEYK